MQLAVTYVTGHVSVCVCVYISRVMCLSVCIYLTGHVSVCVRSGQSPAVAEMNFLVAAAQLDTYGVDPHPVKVLHSLSSPVT